tara:strand:+ start:341 stop:646 length:306 start_codon:yes stop_codon:yes gene_type:complete
MFLKNLKKLDNRVLIVLVVCAIYALCKYNIREGFAPINTIGPAPSEVFTAPHKLECVAGAGPYGQYSKALTPGGFCDLQGKVRASHDYKIDEGGPYGAPLA